MGGMNVALGNYDSRDNWKVHYEDTIKGGQYLNNQELVEVFAKEGIDRIYDLEEYGMLLSRMKNGRIAQWIAFLGFWNVWLDKLFSVIRFGFSRRAIL